MFIFQPAVIPSGVELNVHRLVKVEYAGGELRVIFNSFANELSESISWQDSYPVAVPEINGNVEEWAYSWAVSDIGCFPGGELVDDPTPLEFLKIKARKRVDMILAQKFSSGFVVPSGVMEGQTLQTGTVTDRTNWITSHAMYAQAVLAGIGEEQGAVFRTKSDETFNLTYQEGLNVLNGMAEWGKSVMNRSWQVKDEINSCNTDNEILEVDVHSGWPS